MSNKSKAKVSEAVAEYLEQRFRQGRADNTLRSDRGLLPRFVAHVGDRQFESLTAQHVTDFFYAAGGLMDEHAINIPGRPSTAAVGPSTHNLYRQRLQHFLTWAQREGYTKTSNYVSGVTPMQLTRRRRQQPKPQILLDLLDAAGSARDRAYIALALNTALRASEITRIKVGDVDFDSYEIFVTVIKTHEEDLQPLTADLEKELRVWLREYTRLIGRPLRDEDYLFPNRHGGQFVAGGGSYDENGQYCRTMTPFVYTPDRPLRRSEMIVQHALKAVGLPTRYEGTHTIRRAVARAYFDQLSTAAGYDAALRTVSALLHHSGIQTTERYLGLSSERARRDSTLKGLPFLSAMVAAPATADNVIPLRRA